MLAVVGLGGQDRFRIAAYWAMNMLAEISVFIAGSDDFLTNAVI